MDYSDNDKYKLAYALSYTACCDCAMLYNNHLLLSIAADHIKAGVFAEMGRGSSPQTDGQGFMI